MADKLIVAAAAFVCCVGALLLCFIFFVMLPMGAYADRLCLEKGYPHSSVTYNLDVYCSTLDGAVTFKVQKQ